MLTRTGSDAFVGHLRWGAVEIANELCHRLVLGRDDVRVDLLHHPRRVPEDTDAP